MKALVHLGSVLIAAVVLAGCQPASTPPTASPPNSTAPTTSASGTPTQAAETAVLVYFLRESKAGIRLGREERLVPTGDVLRGAVEAMINGPIDPDYLTSWPEGTEVLDITTSGDVTTVDLSGDARLTTMGSEGSEAAAEQLVWTVTGLQGEDTAVMLTIDGVPAGELWGVIDWSEPRSRGDQFVVRVPVSIDSPLDQATVTSPVTIRGDAAVFEANLPWRVLDANGEVVEEGAAMTTDGTTFAPYTFTLDLPPGDYTVEVAEDDPSGGEGGGVDTDTRRIIVEGS